MSKMKQFFCLKCRENFESKAKYNLAGFRKAKCPKCKQDSLLPLGKGYKITYWFLLVLIVVLFIIDLVGGQFKVTIVGLAIAALAIYSLVKTSKMTKELKIIKK